jgi:hypothetical protein
MIKTLLFITAFGMSIFFQNDFPFYMEYTTYSFNIISTYNLVFVNPTIIFFTLFIVIPLCIEYMRQYFLKLCTGLHKYYMTLVDTFFIFIYTTSTLPIFKLLYIVYNNLSPLNAFNMDLQLFSNTIYSNKYFVIKKQLNLSEIQDSINKALTQLNNLPPINLQEVSAKLSILLQDNNMDGATKLFIELKKIPLIEEKSSLFTILKSSVINMTSFLYDSTILICHSVGTGISRVSTITYNTVNNIVQEDPKSLLIGVTTIIVGIIVYSYYMQNNNNKALNDLVSLVDHVKEVLDINKQSLEVLQTTVENLNTRLTQQENLLTNLIANLNNNITEVSRDLVKTAVSDQNKYIDIIGQLAFESAVKQAKVLLEEELPPLKESLLYVTTCVLENRETLNNFVVSVTAKFNNLQIGQGPL